MNELHFTGDRDHVKKLQPHIEGKTLTLSETQDSTNVLSQNWAKCELVQVLQKT